METNNTDALWENLGLIFCSFGSPVSLEIMFIWAILYLTINVQRQHSVPTQEVVCPICSMVESKGGRMDGWLLS